MRSSRGALTGARITTWLRGGEGARVGDPGARPQQSLVLYEFEACPFCRRVREAFTRLDLEATIRPCPKGGLRYRAEVEALGGKQQFPFLVDPNSDRRMYESSEIVAYLDREYGRAGSVTSPESRAFATLTLIAAGHLQTLPLITHHFPVAQAADAWRLIAQKTEPVLGVILDW